MCLICIDWEKGKLTAREVINNISELYIGADYETEKHLLEIADKLNREEAIKNILKGMP